MFGAGAVNHRAAQIMQRDLADCAVDGGGDLRGGNSVVDQMVLAAGNTRRDRRLMEELVRLIVRHREMMRLMVKQMANRHKSERVRAQTEMEACRNWPAMKQQTQSGGA